MKVEKIAESFYIFGYILELIIKRWRFEIKFFEIRLISIIFSIKNPFCVGRHHIFRVEIWRNFSREKINWYLMLNSSCQPYFPQPPAPPVYRLKVFASARFFCHSSSLPQFLHLFLCFSYLSILNNVSDVRDVKIGTDEAANIASGYHFQRHSCCMTGNRRNSRAFPGSLRS